MNKVMLNICIFVCSVWFVASACAQTKHAFIVGVDKYDNLEPHAQLQRAVNDARSIGAALKDLGYRTSIHENVKRWQFNEAWQTFLNQLSSGDELIIYFSGHGIEINSDNYLLPSDIPMVNQGREAQIKRESISLHNLLLDLREKKPRVSLIILDACRDNPLVAPELRNAASRGGLANIDAPQGTFIMFSAGAGETALDRLPKGDTNPVNSVYTRHLLPLLTTPGLSLQQMATQIRLKVYQLARTVSHRQRPAYYDGVIGTYCVAGCEVGPVVPSRLDFRKVPLAVSRSHAKLPPLPVLSGVYKQGVHLGFQERDRTQPQTQAPVQVSKPYPEQSISEASPAPVASPMRYIAVLSVRPSRVRSLRRLADMQTHYASILGYDVLDVHRVDRTLRGRGVVYRAVLGPTRSRREAIHICNRLRTAGYANCRVAPY